jgi:hypothetical protein
LGNTPLSRNDAEDLPQKKHRLPRIKGEKRLFRSPERTRQRAGEF